MYLSQEKNIVLSNNLHPDTGEQSYSQPYINTPCLTIDKNPTPLKIVWTSDRGWWQTEPGQIICTTATCIDRVPQAVTFFSWQFQC